MRIDVERRDDDVTIVSVVGELDAKGAPAALRALEDAIATGVRRLVVDLTGMSFMDSTGLGVLLYAWSETGRRGGHLALVLPLEAHARRTLNLRGVAERVTIVASREEALATD